MILDNLKLINYKNYRSCSLNFNPRFNFLFGDNGNGKTNILEAISLLCFTKSFLQSSEAECIKYGEKSFEITGEFVNLFKTKNKVKFSYGSDTQKKEIMFNNELVLKFNSFFGTIPLVVLSPYDLKFTAGTPNDKRRNFDILISQVSKLYFSDLKELNKIIKQKNSLLREDLYYKKYSRSKLIELIESWNEKLIDLSVRIILKRINFLKEYIIYLKDSFNKIVGSSIIPHLDYKCESLNEFKVDSLNENELKQNIQNSLLQKIDLEISRGVSLVGPHRDNYFFYMVKNGEMFDVRSFASQGEHKTFVVALKISEYQYLKDKLINQDNGVPIILLDDLFSELDSQRIEKIGSILNDFEQVFLTTTDMRYLDIIKKYFKKEEISSYYVINGTAKENS